MAIAFKAGLGDDPTTLPAHLVHAVRLLAASYDHHREAVLSGESRALVSGGAEVLMAGERILEAA